MAIYLPDDVSRLFYGQFWASPDGEPGSGDEPPVRIIPRKPNVEQDVRVPVWFFSREMRHRREKLYPAIVIQDLGADLFSVIPNLVDLMRVAIDDDTVLYRHAPSWFELRYQVTNAATTYQMIYEITWDVQHHVFPLMYGSRSMLIEGDRREVTMTPRAFRYDEEHGVYRTDIDFSVRLPLYTTGYSDSDGLPTITDLSALLRQLAPLDEIEHSDLIPPEIKDIVFA